MATARATDTPIDELRDKGFMQLLQVESTRSTGRAITQGQQVIASRLVVEHRRFVAMVEHVVQRQAQVPRRTDLPGTTQIGQRVAAHVAGVAEVVVARRSGVHAATDMKRSERASEVDARLPPGAA